MVGCLPPDAGYLWLDGHDDELVEDGVQGNVQVSDVRVLIINVLFSCCLLDSNKPRQSLSGQLYFDKRSPLEYP